ncbi:MAG: stalk domain-containing protein [Paenibacillaceae bacterium]
MIAYKNGTKIELNNTPLIQDGEIYVSITDMTNQLGIAITWNQTTQTMNLEG